MCIYKSNIELYGFRLWDKWHCNFPLEKATIEVLPQKFMILEPRIEQLTKRLNLEGLRILELGCLEGAHSLMLQSLGAKEVIAIEARKENFLKCLVIKNAFNLDRCKFLNGDINKILNHSLGYFDLCLALGIFYHLKDPIPIIYRLGEIANKLFVWTHFSTRGYPEGNLIEIRYNKKIYRGKFVTEDMKDYLSGIQEKSFWIFEDDLLTLIYGAGFKEIKVIQKEKHEHGPAITFLAQK